MNTFQEREDQKIEGSVGSFACRQSDHCVRNGLIFSFGNYLSYLRSEFVIISHTVFGCKLLCCFE